MTESDYILIRNLSNIKHAIYILAEIAPTNSAIIDEKELKSMQVKLYQLMEAHYVAVEKARDRHEEERNVT